MKNIEEELSKYYKHFGINAENLTRLGEMNVMIQALANDIKIDGNDGDNVHFATSYMPRKGYAYEWKYDLTDENSKKEYLKEAKNAIERFKIWQILLERQVKEIEELGYTRTTVYYPEFTEDDMRLYPINDDEKTTSMMAEKK